MKNRNLLYVTVIVSMCVAFSCEEDGERGGGYGPLIGDWEWVRTDGGIGYNIHGTPASTGLNIHCKFTTNRTYSRYVNNVLESEGSYSLESKTCIHSGEKKLMIHFSDPGQPEMMIENITVESLSLSDECFDGIGSEWTKSTAVH
jgi:hypothetical protein